MQYTKKPPPGVLGWTDYILQWDLGIYSHWLWVNWYIYFHASGNMDLLFIVCFNISLSQATATITWVGIQWPVCVIPWADCGIVPANPIITPRLIEPQQLGPPAIHSCRPWAGTLPSLHISHVILHHPSGVCTAFGWIVTTHATQIGQCVI
jgi:hypothetical protein